MDSSEKRPNRPKARQSLAHIPARSQSESFDRHNLTADLSVLDRNHEAKDEKSKRRTRGKSLGPGGLEALKETSGNANKTIAGFQPRSILKPAIPLTPPKNIPSFDELRRRNTGRSKPSPKNAHEELLIDFSTPGPTRAGNHETHVSDNTAVADPFSPIKNSTTDQIESNAADDEAQESKRQAEKQAILERRAARRKSMANRRVSFAPEATLHTWSVMELQEDSTTSSASNSTRRQSSMTTMQSPAPNKDTQSDETPSTPPEQIEEPLVEASPAHQRDLHQKKRRRSSTALADPNASDDDVYSSSPSGDLTTNSSPVRVEESIDSDSDDDDGDTAMSMDDVTAQSIDSQDSNTQSSLDERLRQAASQAGTRGIEYDEHGDESMEIADGTVTSAFQPWIQHGKKTSIVAHEDQENVNPFSAKSGPEHMQGSDDDDNTEGMAMDMTQAVGRIVQANTAPKFSRKSVGSRRKSSVARRQSSEDDSGDGDQTMDFTTIGGGILSSARTEEDKDSHSDDDATMEFTTALGGLKGNDRRSSTFSSVSDDNDTMDMTAAVGGILATIEEHTEPQTDAGDGNTAAMDMTRAGGQIITQAIDEDTLQAEQQMQNEFHEAAHTPQGLPETHHDATTHQFTSVTSETGSPSLAMKPRLSARSRAGLKSQSTTPASAAWSSTAKVRHSAQKSTPQKQMTPVPKRVETPEKTPLAAHVSQRSASPKKLFEAEIKARASPSLAKTNLVHKGDPIVATDSGTGQHTPKYVLHAPKPHQHMRRRSSGVGIDKDGFGSPRVSELLDRRVSIGDAAPEFKLVTAQKGRIRFEDPRQIEQEIDAERAQEERRESGRMVMEREANEQQEENATLQLKDLIASMSPKKNKSRKSLAVGSARGLLGKRPAELDEEDDEDGDHTPKRLKVVARDASPVKAIHLPKPPSKEETTGRLTKAQQLALDAHSTPSLMLSEKQSSAQSPLQAGRFRDAETTGDRIDSFEGKLDNVIGAVDPQIIHAHDHETAEEKISLQDFLNMTNIHFIELSTTKRRHTMAQSLAAQPDQGHKDQPDSLSASFVAASTTLPLLEMYQHATRELKTYISSGRKIIRSIEAETLVDQPPLFREYVEARPDVKLVMDNQFRNGKTNARLQSKEGWYTWRSQLVDGLHAGLEGIKAEMSGDAKLLTEQQTALDKVIPALTGQHKSLQDELTSINDRIEQLESIDQNELKARRSELESVDQSLAERMQLLETLQQEMHEKEDILTQAAELKTEMRDQIAEAERVREEYRGWPAKDVSHLKSKVDKIAETTGWGLLAASEPVLGDDTGITLKLIYKGELELCFCPSTFLGIADTQRRRSNRSSKSGASPSAPVRLTYHSLTGRRRPKEKEFVLELLQNRLNSFAALPHRSVEIRLVLETISKGWDFACKISEEVRLLNLIGITSVTVQNEDTLAISLMLMRAKSRIDIGFTMQLDLSQQSASSISVTATPIHGPVTALLDASKTKKVQVALSREAESIIIGNGALVGAIHAFEEWHDGQMQTKPKLVPAPAPVEAIESHTPPSRPAVIRSPLAAKKSNAIQKKTLPVPSSTQIPKAVRHSPVRKQPQVEKDKENFDPPSFVYGGGSKPAITPEMQEAMMHTPIKRVGALRRSPIGGNGY